MILSAVCLLSVGLSDFLIRCCVCTVHVLVSLSFWGKISINTQLRVAWGLLHRPPASFSWVTGIVWSLLHRAGSGSSCWAELSWRKATPVLLFRDAGARTQGSLCTGQELSHWAKPRAVFISFLFCDAGVLKSTIHSEVSWSLRVNYGRRISNSSWTLLTRGSWAVLTEKAPTSHRQNCLAVSLFLSV